MAICEEFKFSDPANVKLSNHTVAKKLDLVVNSKADDELTDAASEQRAISVAVAQKKKAATNAITNVVKGIFP